MPCIPAVTLALGLSILKLGKCVFVLACWARKKEGRTGFLAALHKSIGDAMTTGKFIAYYRVSAEMRRQHRYEIPAIVSRT